MKTLKILIISIVFVCTSCDNDDNGSSNPIDQLPPATQTGANTVGALVNGDVLLPRGGGLSPNSTCFYQFLNNEYFFGLNFSDRSQSPIKGIGIVVFRIQLEEGQTYALNKNLINDGDFTGAGAEYSIGASSDGNDYYSTNFSITGTLTISRLDEANQIIAGTFQFQGINEFGNTIDITDGRFDMEYSN